MGAQPVILTGTRDNRLKIGLELGADHVVNVRKEPDVVEAIKKLNGGKGVDYVVECSGAPNAVNEAIRMVNRGGKVCLAAFPHEETPVDVAHIVRNNIYLYGIRGEGKSATHRAEAFMSPEALRRHQDPHPHLSARGPADRDPLRQGPRGRRHQGGGEGARRVGRAQSGGGVISSPMRHRHGKFPLPFPPARGFNNSRRRG